MSPYRILLVETEHLRRQTRIALLRAAGYEVEILDLHQAHQVAHESGFDLIVFALETLENCAFMEYREQVSKVAPMVPFLLVADNGAYAPAESIEKVIAAGNPALLLREVASLLTGSERLRNVDQASSS
ncbi:MAG TPA: hypothetical protein VFP40_01485 [Terriglobales bacterium]|nr:hypothetical protein [Terriglobales bacterium]